MLGLGSNLASASIHEQMYSLSLDGSGDLLNTPSSIEGSNFPVTGSLSLWVTGDFTAQGPGNGVDSIFDVYTTARNHIFIRAYDAGSASRIQIQAYGTDEEGYVAGTAFTVLDNQWNHIVVTWDTANELFKVYLNGNTTPVINGSIDVDAGQWTPDGQLCTIGQSWLGSIDDVAIWNAVLDGNTVAAVYNSGKPFDLNYNRGNYTNASALQAYWRMFNGPFDDKVNGVVHDAHNPGYGSEMVTNGTFAADSDWTKGSGWTISGGKAIASGDSGNLYQADTGFVNGGVYKVEYTISDYTKGNLRVILYDGSNNTAIGSTRTANGEYLEYITINNTGGSTTNRILFQTYNSTDEDFKLDNVSIKKLNGHPGIVSANATFGTDTPDD